MLLRDLLQSVWRLRGLEKSQTARFLVSEEVAQVIRQKLNLKQGAPIQFKEILKFVIINQSEQQGKDNYKSLREGYANILQKILLEVLLTDKLKPEARMHAFLNLQSVWLKPGFHSPKELYGTLTSFRKSSDVVENDRKLYAGRIKSVFSKMPWLEQLGLKEEECLKELNAITEQVKNHLAAELQVPAKEIENDETVELEQELKTETERETQLEVQEAKEVARKSVFCLIPETPQLQECSSYKEAVKIVKPLVPKEGGTNFSWYQYVNKVPVFPLNSYLQSSEELQEYQKAFDGIQLSFNVLDWSNRGGDYEFLGSRRTDIHHLLIQEEKVILLTQDEAQKHKGSPDYFNLTLGFNDPNKKLTRDQAFKILKVKFLNGESNYSQEEIDQLRLWIKAQGPKRMHDLFTKKILGGYPVRARAYQDSPLQRLFAELS